MAHRPVDERLLDMLLKEASARRVLKEGIKYSGRVYWHADLAILVGEDVLVRAAPSYKAPDELEVYAGNQWRCTAFALDSAKGRELPRSVVSQAQRQQRAHARQRIAAAQETKADVPASKTARRSASKRTEPLAPVLPVPVSSARPPDLFDVLIAQQTRKDHSHDS